MKSHTHYLWFNTKQRQEIIDITDEVVAQVEASGVAEGLVLVSAMHITASVFVNDHESGLWGDILKWLETTIAPWDPKRYRHNETGEDNAAAHLRSLTIGHEVLVPVTGGKLDLGPWQRVFYGEWDGQRKKRVIIKQLPAYLFQRKLFIFKALIARHFRAGVRSIRQRLAVPVDPGLAAGAPWWDRRPPSTMTAAHDSDRDAHNDPATHTSRLP